MNMNMVEFLKTVIRSLVSISAGDKVNWLYSMEINDEVTATVF